MRPALQAAAVLSLLAACSDEPGPAEHNAYSLGVGQVPEEPADGGGERIELIEVAEP